MTTITFVNVQDDLDYSVHAHKAGCRDIARTLKRNPQNLEADGGEFTTEEEAFLNYNGEFIEEGSEGYDIKFHACTKLKKAEPKMEELDIEIPAEEAPKKKATTKPARRYFNHKVCDHPLTPAARAECRAAMGR